MALVSIDGVDLPTPSDYQVEILDISKAERNANGTMIIERITTKRKISVKYNYLNSAQLKDLLTKLAPTFFNVTYLDPQDNITKTSSFYCGDRNASLVDFVDNTPRYKDVSFNLIER